MYELLSAFLVSAAVNLVLVRSAKVHAHRSGDRDFSKPQGFHAAVVPRIGGLGIVLGLITASLILEFRAIDTVFRMPAVLLGCAIPAFASGFIQDFTEAITPRGRLAATAVSAALAYLLLGAGIHHSAIPGLDWILGTVFGSFVLTIFTVAGLANAVNIIDGFNGLASMCVMLMLAAVGYVAFQVGDSVIGLAALAGIGAVFGFFLWNFPSGLIFLGDGGAYFLGFMVAELSIMLLVRNAGEVSPIFPLLVCIYPVFETLFSIYRRRFLRAMPPSTPDGIHLHSLIYRRVSRGATHHQTPEALVQRNSMTSPFLWLLCLLSVVPAALCFNSTFMLWMFVVLFAVSYVLLYWSIVRFKSPRWLRVLAHRPRVPLESDNRRT